VSGPRFDLSALMRLYGVNTLWNSQTPGPVRQSSRSPDQELSDHIRFAQIVLILLADRSLGSSTTMNIDSSVN